MCTLFKLPCLIVSTFGLMSFVSAAFIGATSTSRLEVRNGKHFGWATYYNVEENMGACGWRSKNIEHVAAIGGANKWSCGKTAMVSYKGKTVRVGIVDKCPVCGNSNIDLSPAAFDQLAPKSEGKLNGVVWWFE